MGFGSGGGGNSKTELRYAKYVELKHSEFLTAMRDRRNAAIDNSPFANYVPIVIDDAFFGIGYTIASFPSLYDMYGKFLAGLDIEALYSQLYEDTVNSPITNELIAAEGALIDDEININSLPRFQAGMRDINSVMSSSFVIGKSLIEDTRTKAISKFSSELKYKLIPVAQDRWTKHLEWNRNVVTNYAEIMKFYYMAKCDVDDQNGMAWEKDRLWPFTVLDFERSGLGALQGATTTKGSQKGSKLAGALSGAAAGGMIGGVPGAIIGGLAGLFMS